MYLKEKEEKDVIYRMKNDFASCDSVSEAAMALLNNESNVN